MQVVLNSCRNRSSCSFFPSSTGNARTTRSIRLSPFEREDPLHLADPLPRDHAEALWQVLNRGQLGDTYNIGGHNEWANLRIVELICDLVDELAPQLGGGSRQLITFVKDRPGHDRRYAIDARKIERELGWRPAETFETGIRKTVQWYLANPQWVADVQSGAYRDWIETNYAARATA